MQIRIGKRTLDQLPAIDRKGGARYTDQDLRGFSVVKYPSGRIVYFVAYGGRGNRKSVRLGTYPPMPPEKARTAAMEILLEYQKGGDPVEEKRRSKAVPTFKSWMDTYMVEVERRKKHPRNDRRYLGMAEERWGTRLLDSIDVTDVRKAFESITNHGKPIDANRWLASVRACLQAAWREDLVVTNPAMKVKPNRENPPRDRTLSDDEFRRLLAAVDELQDPHVKAGFLMLIETGARLSEVLRAEWSQVDLDEGTWRIPSTKAGRPQVLPLARSTVAMLRNLDRLGSYIVAGRDPETPRSDLKRPWAALQKAADISDVHVHDLRRTFGLHVARRAGIHVASRLLRHNDIRVTERHYAPLGLDDLRQALEVREADIVPLRLPGRLK